MPAGSEILAPNGKPRVGEEQKPRRDEAEVAFESWAQVAQHDARLAGLFVQPKTKEGIQDSTSKGTSSGVGQDELTLISGRPGRSARLGSWASTIGAGADASKLASQRLAASASSHDPAARLSGKVSSESGEEATAPGAPRLEGEPRDRSGRSGEARSELKEPTTTNSPSRMTQDTSGGGSSAPAAGQLTSRMDQAVKAVAALGPLGGARGGAVRSSVPLALGGARAMAAGGMLASPQSGATGGRAGAITPTQGVRFGVQSQQGGKLAAQVPARGAQEKTVAAQAVQGLAAVLRQKGGSVTMRLTPESLGEVRVSMKLEGERVWAEIRTSTDSARRLLEDQRDTLRSALEARGLKVERLEIAAAPVEGAKGESAPFGGAEASNSQAQPDGSAFAGGDHRGAGHEGWKPTGSGSNGSSPGEVGGADEVVYAVGRGTPLNIWAEPEGSLLRLRVDALA